MTFRNAAWRLAGCLFFLAMWQGCAAKGGFLAFASPAETLTAMARLLARGSFWIEGIAPSFCRLGAGFVIGVAAGGVLGGFAGLWPAFGLFLLPFRWVLSSVPGIVLVILAMLWFGSGSGMVTVIVALTVTPTIYLAMQEGIAAIDGNLREMARAYSVPPVRKLTELYLPAVSAPLLSAGVVALGGGMRVAIMGETLGASRGLGYTLAVARSNLDAAELYAVAFISMLLVSLLETAFLSCIRKKLQGGEGA